MEQVRSSDWLEGIGSYYYAEIAILYYDGSVRYVPVGWISHSGPALKIFSCGIEYALPIKDILMISALPIAPRCLPLKIFVRIKNQSPQT